MSNGLGRVAVHVGVTVSGPNTGVTNKMELIFTKAFHILVATIVCQINASQLNITASIFICISSFIAHVNELGIDAMATWLDPSFTSELYNAK